MWKCPNCNRIFERNEQSHSCQSVSIEEHFKSKELAKSLFDVLLARITKEIGKCELVSLPCCIHLFGEYDFLAALPKKDGLEIKFALNRLLSSSRLIQVIPASQTAFKNCVDIGATRDIDKELICWVRESYFLEGKH